MQSGLPPPSVTSALHRLEINFTVKPSCSGRNPSLPVEHPSPAEVTSLSPRQAHRDSRAQLRRAQGLREGTRGLGHVPISVPSFSVGEVCPVDQQMVTEWEGCG